MQIEGCGPAAAAGALDIVAAVASRAYTRVIAEALKFSSNTESTVRC